MTITDACEPRTTYSLARFHVPAARRPHRRSAEGRHQIMAEQEAAAADLHVDLDDLSPLLMIVRLRPCLGDALTSSIEAQLRSLAHLTTPSPIVQCNIEQAQIESDAQMNVLQAHAGPTLLSSSCGSSTACSATRSLATASRFTSMMPP